MEKKLEYKALELADAKSAVAGEISWQSPSNIALVKYWGKYGRQLPSNPSVSFTLKNAHTKMRMKYKEGSGQVILFFEGERNTSFEARIAKFIDSIKDVYPFLQAIDLEIHSSNSFPHSAGIASSASAMSALCLCLCSIERNHFASLTEQADFLKKSSYLSRLASGSACRSVYPKLGQWGYHEAIVSSTDLYAIDVSERVDRIFHSFKNSILIASAKEKSVSSSAGHQLMENNPFAEVRFKQANKNLADLMQAMKTGDLNEFIRIVEEEALTLHALMMTSNPSYILMKANSLVLIEKVRAFRGQTKLPLCFTLDAGPNLHLLYPASIQEEVQVFIQSELKQHCENGMIIEDEVGEGASLL
ncbi:MAG: diphosphomevalonate decarboxylase [Chitinophagales bacterium]|nr:diphosphomevalonate decarboxylase [Chitinophagales bacterium]